MSNTLFRVKDTFHYRFQVDGRRTQRSTGETDRARAEKIAARAYRDAKLWSREGKEVPTLRELTAQWIAIHTATASSSHIKVVETFGRLHTYHLGDMLIDEITTASVESARVKHLENHAPISANQWLKVIRLLCSWAIRRGVLPVTPFHVRALTVQKKPRAVLPANMAQDWLAAIDRREGNRQGVRTAVRLMLALGLRESEAASSRYEWLDIERRQYTPGKSKNKRAEPLPVPDWLFDYLTPMRQPSGLIIAHEDGTPFPPGFTRAAMLHANQAVGAPHITPHRLRTTFATLLSQSGVPVQDIQRALRHSNITTTAAYLENDMDHVVQGQALMAQKIGFGLHNATTVAPVANDAA